MEIVNSEIKKSICIKLSEIEQQENVRIIYAVESGSRSWGFPSRDSDYDVRFVYVRQPRDYLRIEEMSDVIDWQLDEVYDINGWDLKKFLRLLHRANQTAFEWAQSPIVYRSTPQWEKILPALGDFFNPKGAMFHYLSFAKANSRHLNEAEVSLKKYLYTLRPLLACRWIEDRKTPPPIVFDELIEAYLPKELSPSVNELLAAKEAAPEKGMIPRIEALSAHIEAEFSALCPSADNMRPGGKGDIERLDRIFGDIVLD